MDYLDAVLKFLDQGWVGSLAAIIFGILALLVAYLLYLRSRASPSLVYQRRSIRLIGGTERALPDEVQVSFQGVTVSRLTTIHIVLWNAGAATVRGSDIVAADPLRFVFAAGARVLRARVVRPTRLVNGFHIGPNPQTPNEALWGFDFLDPGDGAVLEILHTGEDPYPEVRGTIRGIPAGVKDRGLLRSYRPLPIAARNLLIWALAAAMAGAWWLAFSPSPPLFPSILSAGVGIVTGLGIVAFLFPLVAALTHRYPSALSAGELE